MSKRWRKIILFTTLPVIAIGGFVYWLGWSGTTDHIESIANQFKPNSSWELVSSYAKPPQTLCFAETCPRLTKIWTTPTPVTQAEIADVLNHSGWTQITPEYNCQSSDDASGSDACRFHGFADKYEVIISTLTENPSFHKPTVSLFMK